MRDVNRAKAQARDEAIALVWAIMFTALRDKFGFGPVRLRRVWEACEYISDSIVRGYVKPKQLINELRDAGIDLIDGGENGKG